MWIVMFAMGCGEVGEQLPTVTVPAPPAGVVPDGSAAGPDAVPAPTPAEGASTMVPPSCDDTSKASAPLSSDCVTTTLSCGEQLQGHTQGGAEGWGDSFYRGHHCTPMPEGYSGPERVYRFAAPANQLIELELVSPCADLDLFAVSWPETSRCPTDAHMVSSCDASVRKGNDRVKLFTDRNPRTYLVTVDGKGAATAPFTLRASCTPT